MNTGERVRIGIIGGGSIAAQHLSGYLEIPEAATVNAIADIDPEHARVHADRAGGARVFLDYHDMLASNVVDAVDPDGLTPAPFAAAISNA